MEPKKYENKKKGTGMTQDNEIKKNQEAFLSIIKWWRNWKRIRKMGMKNCCHKWGKENAVMIDEDSPKWKDMWTSIWSWI